MTLTSDVGSAYAAQMKAVLVAGGVPPGQIVDLAHDLAPHGVREAAFLFREMARGFPRPTVHLVIVDPGVGGRRQPIVIATRSGPLLVGPDNGVLVPLARELGLRRAYRIRDPGRGGARVGTTFDGRDVFAPTAARLALGDPLASVGPRTEVRPYAIPEPVRRREGARGEVVHIDRFGNVITNVPSRWVGTKTRRVVMRCGRSPPRTLPWVTSYERLGRGRLGALASSFGLVEVAVAEGRASDRLKVRVGSPVTLAWRPAPAARTENANSARPRKRR